MNISNMNLNFGSMNMNNYPSTIIVHHLEAEGVNWTVQTIHNMHKNENGWAGIGYHYYIRLDGTVYKGRPDNAIGSHCKGANSNSLGVAFEGNYDKRSIMPEVQFNAWCALKQQLYTKYGNIPVFGHREKGSSECPGKLFPLEKIRNANVSNKTIGWNKDTTGWWYCLNLVDGSYHKDKWAKIDNEWYSFDSQGYARSNTWLQDKGIWYYLKENCIMAKSQWLWINEECYCFKESGEMYVDCITPDGYKVDKDGAWIS